MSGPPPRGLGLVRGTASVGLALVCGPDVHRRCPMSPGRRDLLIAGAALAALVASVEAAAAQTPAPSPETPLPERTAPQDPRSTGSAGRSTEPLSDKLDRSGGVIRPPADIAPEMAVRRARSRKSRAAAPSAVASNPDHQRGSAPLILRENSICLGQELSLRRPSSDYVWQWVRRERSWRRSGSPSIS
jgi:hypothetical protein